MLKGRLLTEANALAKPLINESRKPPKAVIDLLKKKFSNIYKDKIEPNLDKLTILDKIKTANGQLEFWGMKPTGDEYLDGQVDIYIVYNPKKQKASLIEG